jgi:hypothetical protein
VELPSLLDWWVLVSLSDVLIKKFSKIFFSLDVNYFETFMVFFLESGFLLAGFLVGLTCIVLAIRRRIHRNRVIPEVDYFLFGIFFIMISFRNIVCLSFLL